MASERMTFTVSAALKKRAQQRHDIYWSAVVQRAIQEKLEALEIADRITAQSRLAPEDVHELADLVDQAMAKHFGVAP